MVTVGQSHVKHTASHEPCLMLEYNRHYSTTIKIQSLVQSLVQSCQIEVSPTEKSLKAGFH